MFSLAFSFSFLSRHWFWRSSRFCGSPEFLWKSTPKTVLEGLSFSMSSTSPMSLHPPVDDEGSGNRLHLTWVLSWIILSHPSMNDSDVVLSGRKPWGHPIISWYCWSWIGELCQDPCYLTPRQRHIQYSHSPFHAHKSGIFVPLTVEIWGPLRWISHLRQNRTVSSILTMESCLAWRGPSVLGHFWTMWARDSISPQPSAQTVLDIGVLYEARSPLKSVTDRTFTQFTY